MLEKPEAIKDDVSFILSFIDKQTDSSSLVTNIEVSDQKIVVAQLLTACATQYNAQEILIAAIPEHRSAVVRNLLKYELIKLDEIKDEKILILAAAKGDLKIAKTLFKYSTCYNLIEIKEVIIQAALNKNDEIVEFILQKKEIVSPDLYIELLQTACQNNRSYLINLLLSKYKRNINMQHPILWCAKKGFFEAVKMGLTDFFSTQYAQESETLHALVKEIVRSDNAEILQILLNYKETIEALNYCPFHLKEAESLFTTACRLGYEKIVALLLADERINPAINNNHPIRVAALSGHVEIVKLLLTDERVDPMDTNHESSGSAVHKAIQNADVEMVKLFLLNARVNVYSLYSIALELKNWNIIKIMWKENYIQPNTKILLLASLEGDVESVKELLTYPNVKPQINKQEALLCACRKGHLAIVDLLLNDPRIEPQAFDNKAIKTAVKNSQIQIVKRLLKEERVNPFERKFEPNDLIRFWNVRGLAINHEILKLLLLDKRILQQSFKEFLGGFYTSNDFIPKIYQDYLINAFEWKEVAEIKKLLHLVVWLLEGIYASTDYIIKTKVVNDLNKTLNKFILFFVQNNCYEEAIRCWLVIPSTGPNFREARFEAFQCAYNYCRMESNKAAAFVEALIYCLDKEVILSFAEDQQSIFDCYLLEASGINVFSFKMSHSNLTPQLRQWLLQYLILLAVKNELLALTQISNKLAKVSTFYAKHGLLAEEKKQGIIMKINKLLPESLEDLNQLESIFNGNNFSQDFLALKEVPIKNKNLKCLIGIFGDGPGPSPAEIKHIG